MTERVTAYRANDGSLHETEAAARRIDDAVLAKSLLAKLDACFARAEAAKIGREFGLLEFVRSNAAAIRAFMHGGAT